MEKRSLYGRIKLFRNGDVLFLLFIFLAFLVLLRESYNYPQESRIFPELIIWCTLLLSGSLLFIYLFIPSWKEAVVSPDGESEADTASGGDRAGRFFRGWICIGLSLLTAFLCGFLFLIPAAFLSYTLLLGRKGMLGKILLIALTTTLVIYGIFDYFLGIPTLHGFIWSLW